LDKDSEGLILLTNDGELTQHLTHPKYEQDKEYRVLVAKRPDPEQLGAWRRGIVLPEGERSEPADVRVDSVKGKGAWLRVIMHEGRKREIREIARTLGLPVVTLIRVRIASLYLGVLKAGQWRKLDAAEVELLKSGKKPTPTKANHKDAKNNKSGVVHKGKSSQSPNQSFKRNQGLVRKKSKNAGDKAGHKGKSNRSPNQSFLRNQRLARKKGRKR
jgi:23S rRNA pseudouridine2605 synthase